VHQIRFRPGTATDTVGRALQDPLLDFKGSKRRDRKGEGKGGREEELKKEIKGRRMMGETVQF